MDDQQAKTETWRSGAPPSLPGEADGVPRVTLEQLIGSLSPVTHTPHETLAAAVHLVVAGRVYLVEGAESDSDAVPSTPEHPPAARRRGLSSSPLRRMLELAGLLAAGPQRALGERL